MGRDKVLGLSLAILLIGFAAAFCFRNEQFVESGLKLARAKILDEAIAQRPGPKPYASEPKAERDKSTLPTVTLQGIESVEPFSDLQTAQPADREKATASKGRKKALAEAATDRADVKPSTEAARRLQADTLTTGPTPGPRRSTRTGPHGRDQLVEAAPSGAGNRLLSTAPPLRPNR